MNHIMLLSTNDLQRDLAMKIVGDPENFKQPYDEDEDYVSRTQFKRESEAAQELGVKLTKLSKKQLQKMDLDETLYGSILELDNIKAKTEAYRRHLQYIGKIMRSMDLEVIQRSLDNLMNKNRNLASQTQVLEKLRDKLINEGDDEIQRLIQQYPRFNRQKLRQLVRNAKKELSNLIINDEGEEVKPSSKSAQELFKYLKTEIE